ncbi:MAG: hypothetical protein C6I00_03550 [Nitratiruptor sp.]|nr:hypothetical protein [Nitratiruptor sp.]NPA83125.1 hypothetical protein [Campylobacterota bacterium]
MGHIREFDRHAAEYEGLKLIQLRVARHLLEKSPYQGRRILDLGAGNGTIWRLLPWEVEAFYALDASFQMLALHPPVTQKILGRFDRRGTLEYLAQLPIDQIFAASSLQWSRDIKGTLSWIAALQSPCSLALFTSATFQSLHQIANLSSPIYSKEELLPLLESLFPRAHLELRQYRLFFPTKRDLFGYLRRSGVSQGVSRLSYSQAKRLIRDYPHRYLEFEVLFLWSK